ncbi:MAG: molybdenum cofactor synthesis domain-containing protein [Alphaproteobacteria bacterium]|jgi:molybdenum cofactor synthesis domain-containing protein
MTNPSCAIILIGNEILSGRTPDENMNHIARRMADIGVRLQECRVIPDDKEVIVNTLNELRKKYTYVFTTGGIGPTHDDITVECVAEAFKVPIERDEATVQAFEEHFKGNTNESLLKMAHFPKGAGLVVNPLSIAPGFRMENVYCMAGVPKIMRVMLEAIIPNLKRGSEIFSKSIDVFAGESIISHGFENIQRQYEEVELGSYPFRHDGKGATSLVMRSDNTTALGNAYKEVISLLNNLDVEYR